MATQISVRPKTSYMDSPSLPATVQSVLVEQQNALRLFLDEWTTNQERVLGQAFATISDKQPDGGDFVLPGADVSQSEAASPPSKADATTRVTTYSLATTTARGAFSVVSVAPSEFGESPLGGRSSIVPCGLPKGLHQVGWNTQNSKALQPSGSSHPSLPLGRRWSLRNGNGQKGQESLGFPLAAKLEKTRAFQAGCSAVILANAVFLAWSADYYVDNINAEQNTTLISIEGTFVLLYTLELVVRLLAGGRSFFFGDSRAWNWFDLLLVLSGMREVIQSALGAFGTGDNFSYLRTLRLLKMLKFLRIIRLLRAFRELRLALDSILGSMKSLIWSVLLILAMNFMFGVCFLAASAEFLHEHEGIGDMDDKSQETCRFLRQYWGSMGTAMGTLFASSTGGYSWAEAANPLWEVGMGYYGIFCLYIGFFHFVIMNTITSIVIDGMREHAERDQSATVNDHLARKEEYKAKIEGLFTSMDTAENGLVSWEEFQEYMSDPLAVAFAESLDLEVMDLKQVYKVISVLGQKRVDSDAFVTACIKLRGGAKQMDMIEVQMALRTHMGYCTKQFDSIQSQLASFRLGGPAAGSSM